MERQLNLEGGKSGRRRERNLLLLNQARARAGNEDKEGGKEGLSRIKRGRKRKKTDIRALVLSAEKKNFLREKERQAIHPSVFLNVPLPPFHLEWHSPQKEQQNTMLQIFSKWTKKKLHGHLGAQLNAPKGSPKGESSSTVG